MKYIFQISADGCENFPPANFKHAPNAFTRKNPVLEVLFADIPREDPLDPIWAYAEYSVLHGALPFASYNDEKLFHTQPILIVTGPLRGKYGGQPVLLLDPMVIAFFNRITEETTILEPKIIAKQENIPSFDPNAVAVKHIEYYPYGGTYNEDEIGRFDNWYSYDPDHADTIEQIKDADFSNKNIYTSINSGRQSPIPKIQAVTDMDTGVKAVEYFIRTGQRYPGIDWMR